MLSKIHASHKKDLEKKESEILEKIDKMKSDYEHMIEGLNAESKQKGISLLELNNQLTGILENSSS